MIYWKFKYSRTKRALAVGVSETKIIKLILNTKWSEKYPMTATPNLSQWQIYKYIKEQIPEIQ